MQYPGTNMIPKASTEIHITQGIGAKVSKSLRKSKQEGWRQEILNLGKSKRIYASLGKSRQV